MRTLRQTNNLLFDLPQSVNRIIKKAIEGNLRMEFELQGFDNIMNQLMEMVNILSLTILVASFVVGFSLILQQARLPGWMQIALEVVFFYRPCWYIAVYIHIYLIFQIQITRTKADLVIPSQTIQPLRKTGINENYRDSRLRCLDLQSYSLFLQIMLWSVLCGNLFS